MMNRVFELHFWINFSTVDCIVTDTDIATNTTFTVPKGRHCRQKMDSKDSNEPCIWRRKQQTLK